MRALVVGGTGTVGSHVVSGLLTRGVDTRVLVRSSEKANRLPPGAVAAVGNLERRETLPRAFQGADAVFLLNPMSQRETDLGMACVHAAVAGRARRLVYMSVVIPPGAERIPHFASKIPLEVAVRRSGLEWTILRPNNFFQNDLFMRDSLLQFGVYPQPIGGRGTWRVDVRDIAEVAVTALTTDGHDTQEYDIHGGEALTGESVAAHWSAALGREIRYAGDDLDRWAQVASGMMPPWMVDDLRIMFEYFQQHGMAPAPGAVERLEQVLGHAPRRFEDFAKETAAAWNL